MIEHCVAAFQQEEKELAFRIYVTDALKMLVENTTHYLGLNGIVDYGRTLTARWYDLVSGNIPETEKPEEDTRSCAEITAGIWKRAKLKATEGGA